MHPQLVYHALLALLMAGTCTQAGSYELGHYREPTLAEFKHERVKYLDKDADGEKETITEIMRNGTDQFVMRYTTNGLTWAWGFIGDFEAGPDNTEVNHVIRDSDGDGESDKRYSGTAVQRYSGTAVQKSFSYLTGCTRFRAPDTPFC
jgi:hypothetical protein